MNTGLIYMRTSPSGKSYIGQTIQSEIIRWKQHCQCANNKNSNLYNSALSYAIRKYGQDNFTVTILKNNIPIEKLNLWEKYYIELYNTYKNGYNSSLGGEGGGRKYDYKEFLALWNQGETVRRISNILGCAENTTHRILVSEGITDQELKERQKEDIYLFKKDDRELLQQEYLCGASIKCLANKYKVSYTAIRNALVKENTPMRKAQGKENKRIAQIDKDNNKVLCYYDSVREAARAVNGVHQSISQVANHKNNRKVAYGYHWEWEDNIKENLNG